MNRSAPGPRIGWALPWLLYATVLVLAPWLWPSSLGLTVLSQMGVAIIACLSYNVLYGQGGMLSFGHALYSGLGAYAAIHALQRLGSMGDVLAFNPVPWLPLVGGLGGLLAAAVLGGLISRSAGNAFAMITLGVGELVWALASMWPEVFGGEGGLSANRVVRVVGPPLRWAGQVWTFGPAIEVYVLIAAYCLACTLALHAFTRTPLGRMLNALRDNPQRVGFIGVDARQVRWRAFVVAGFFAGVAGGLSALQLEIVGPDALSAQRSGAYLLFTFFGGAGLFAGPIVGGVLMVLALVLLSDWTQAWLLYLGLLFLAMVLWAPGGLTLLALRAWHAVRGPQGGERLAAALALLGTGLTAVAGFVALVELAYHRRLDGDMGTTLRLAGFTLDARHGDAWIGAALLLVVGAGLSVLAGRHARALAVVLVPPRTAAEPESMEAGA